MQIYHGLADLPKVKRVIALGNFDGIHIGHRPIIEAAVRRASEKSYRSAVLMFDPHPMQVLQKNSEFQLLTTPKQRAGILKKMNVDELIRVPFTKKMQQMQPEAFVEQVLISICDAACISVGYDYSFGCCGRGKTELLQSLGNSNGFELIIQPSVDYLQQPVSSTRIRSAVTSGELKLAAVLLGRSYEADICLELTGQEVGMLINFSKTVFPEEGRYEISFYRPETKLTYPGIFYVFGEQSLKYCLQLVGFPQESSKIFGRLTFLSDSLSE
ncbi:MAG TPA: FAD synthetase family protein [Bacillota bacterium]|nr:FAD synthetase family protein [Bacillota bacterium]